MFTAAQLVAHLVGDYILQTDHQAVEKRKRWAPAIFHALTYTLPFLLLTRSPHALAVIVCTHAVIDRYGLARYVCWLKNFIGSPWSWEQVRAFLGWRPGMPMPEAVWSGYRRPWSECTKTGYPDDRPAWLTTWLLIIADNCLHLLINGAALEWHR